MKKFFIYISITFLVIISCSKDDGGIISFCPHEPEYHFFSGNELTLLWENVDSALILQNKLSSGEIEQYDANDSYGMSDTIPFVNQFDDTLDFIYVYELSPKTNQWCANAIPMGAKSSLISINESFINEIHIELEKSILDELLCRIYFVFNYLQDLISYFSLSDTVKIDYNSFDGGVNNSTIYLKTYKSTYQHENMTIEDCLFFLFYDQNLSEKFKVVYSNKYGFLSLTKNQYHEITRCF
jgi:hypothetical protein